ncbi:hypothetical protein [Zoogloea sp.]|uniref:DUF7832 domain-containing protein n=1 Tax=Zoogloea sp. TaxID=49181 RepID=UPI001AC8B1FC|nr:hypothetical protein [Zoogloea sp.]MBN8282784.1 hypothetical protein [Zoogloea sp.]
MKYDDANWHCGSDNFPEDQPEEYGATHIGLFLKWCFIQGWAGALHLREEPDAVHAVIAGRLSGTEFLLTYCDGKLTNESLNAAGNAFAEKYYGDQGLYLQDYSEHFGHHEYSSPESAHDFAAFSSLLNGRLKSKELTRKPWWKRW